MGLFPSPPEGNRSLFRQALRIVNHICDSVGQSSAIARGDKEARHAVVDALLVA